MVVSFSRAHSPSCKPVRLDTIDKVAKIFAQRKVSLLVAQPSAPENCTIFRGPKGYAEVQCTANYNGGVRQTYYLEVYDNAKTVMYGNYTNSKRPHFVLRNLGGGSMAYPTDTHYRLEAFATNRKGPSNKAKTTKNCFKWTH